MICNVFSLRIAKQSIRRKVKGTQFPSGVWGKAPTSSRFSLVRVVLHVHLVRVRVGREGGDHLHRRAGIVDDLVNLARLDVDHLARTQMVDHAVHNDIHFAFQNVEILFHHVVIVRLEILTGLKLHEREVHARTLHQVLGAAVAKAIFFIFFVYDIHSCFLPSRLYRF